MPCSESLTPRPQLPQILLPSMPVGIPGGSDGKASACNAGDPGSIPGSRRSPREGNGSPLQYSCWKISWIEEPGRLHSPWGRKEADVTERLHFPSMPGDQEQLFLGRAIIPLLLTRVLDLLHQQKLIRDQTSNSGNTLWGSCCSSRSENKEQVPLLAHSLGEEWRWAGSLYDVKVGVFLGVGPEEWLRCLPTP